MRRSTRDDVHDDHWRHFSWIPANYERLSIDLDREKAFFSRHGKFREVEILERMKCSKLVAGHPLEYGMVTSSVTDN